jgi:FLVCR family MFS transporter 7
MPILSDSWAGTRWVFLFAHCCLAAVNGFQYANFGPVPDESKSVFGMDNSNLNNLLLVYVLIWLPMMPFSMPLQQKVGPQGALVVAAVINTLAAGIKVIAFYAARGFPLIVTGQAFAGAAEVFFLPLPALIASTWFPSNLRTVATALGSLANSVGVSLGFAVVPRVVSDAARPETGFEKMLLGQLVFSAVIVLMALLLPRKPARAPSATAAKSVPLREIPTTLKVLLKNRSYVVFTVASGLSIAVGWTFSGMCTEFLKPFGVSEDNAGLMGSLFSILGSVGQFVAGYVGDRTRQYLPIIVGCYAVSLTLMCLLGALLAFNVDATVAGFVTLPAMGFFFVASLPPMYEYLIELTFPAPVPVAVGVQMLLSRILFSPVVNPVGSALITNSADKANGLHFVLSFIIFFAACLVALVGVKDERKRYAAEISAAAADAAGVSTNFIADGSEPLVMGRGPRREDPSLEE